ncbi:MAG: ATP-binding cassette domain-containing protein [Patescibacteria group bacterium]|nr:ATP-binding cassette domain-containing protein [Patescibacteria group bacterium]
MPLIQLRDVSLQFRGPRLLDAVGVTIDPGERICLIGRNGEGKTTLLRLVNGQMQPDAGQIIRGQGVTTALVDQQVPVDLAGTIFDLVAGGLAEQGKLLTEYHQVVRQLATRDERALHARLDELTHQLELTGAWSIEQRVETVLSRMGLDPDIQVATLSAGMKRRVLLARALVQSPDVLLLDEPTNHLDIATIEWLEEFLLKQVETLLFVTHDRRFLRRVATRVLDLDRGQLTSWACDYDTYEARKEAALAAEAAQQAEFDRRLALEEKWIRTGIQARRTRNEGRVRRLLTMRSQRQDRRERTGAARMQMQEAERSGRLVAELKDVSFHYADQPIVSRLSTVIMRGDRIGIIGPNGIGKSTLLRLILAELSPTEGTVRHGTKLQVAYFDQLHAQLDLEKTVVENLSDGSDTVSIDGKKKHVYGYLQDFLFTPERAKSPVKQLSGGERNRLLLARLLARPSNVLVLDEPTNDLDAETLDLLEELLMEYSGTVLLVSHDREFLNNVVTSTLVFEGNGQVGDYAGGYDDWLVQRKSAATPNPRPEKRKPEKPKPTKPKPTKPTAERPQPEKPRPQPAAKRLTYKEKLELESLPGQIEQLDARQRQLHQVMADPGFYRQDRQKSVETTTELESVDRQLAKAYARWEALEAG